MQSLATDQQAKPVTNPRGLALQILAQVIERGQSLNQALENKLGKLDNSRDRGFCSEVCYGVCRYYFVLKHDVDSRLKKPLKSRDADVMLIILIGLYQIRFMRVSDHAAVNETVKLLNKVKKSWARGLVNALLRNYLREVGAKSSTELSADEQSQAYPGWIREKIHHDWGEQTLPVMSAGNKVAPMVLRVDTHQLSREEYLQMLAEESISATAHAVVAGAIVLNSPVSVDKLPGFENGQVSVQDASAQIAAPLLDCRSGMSVLDACAAPGGKTLHLLQASPGIELTALDKDAQRLQKVAENLARSGVDARLVSADAGHPNGWYQGQPFDRILVDAPCSASGIIRRHPDIRLLRKSSDISSLAKQQRRLLNALWSLLKPGGRMVYSTCSIFKEENEDQVAAFLQQQADCTERVIDDVLWGEARAPGRQILPGRQEMDGFYYACLEKSG